MWRLQSFCVVLTAFIFISSSPHEFHKLKHKTVPTGDGDYVQLSRGRVRYELSAPSSTGLQLTVLVAGLGAPMENMVPLAKYLQQEYPTLRTLTYDVYGRGWSDAPAGPLRPGPAFELYVAQLAELLFALNETGKVNLIGLSMGGSIMNGFAKIYPERVQSLIMFAPPVLELSPIGKLALKVLNNANEGLLHTLGRIVIPYALERNIHVEFKTPETKQAKAVIEAILNQDMDILSPTIIMTVLAMDFNHIQQAYMDMARNYKGKLLLVWGEEDVIAPCEKGRNLQRQLQSIRDTDFISVPKMGHFLVSEYTAIYNEIGKYLTTT